jgi:hypothetical protein
MILQHRSGGFTYFKRWAFSINEGQFPNVHVNFRTRFFYVALSPRLKWHNGLR